MRYLLSTLAAAACCGAAGADDRREQFAETLAPLLLKPPCEGLLVYDVLPRLQAEKAGLRPGDILTHYDGKAVRTAGQLQGLARAAAAENRGNLMVVAQRGAEKIEATFDAAPMGLRFVAVNPSDRRVLWRPATPYEPNWQPLRKMAAAKHMYGFVVYGDKPVGWTRTYLQALGGDRYVLRTQSLSQMGAGAAEKRDTTIVFAADRPTLTPLAIRTSTNGKPTLNLARQGNALRGDRYGIPEAAALPPDTMAAELVALAASAMPRAKDACLRGAYLPPGALSAAPYADLCCLGAEKLGFGKQVITCHRYDQTEFGRSMAHYWLDPDGAVLRVRFGGGSDVVRASSTDVGMKFPNYLNEFPPIEQLPEMPGAAPRLGN